MSDHDGTVTGAEMPRMKIEWPTRVDRKGRKIVLKDAAGLFQALDTSEHGPEGGRTPDKDMERMLEWAKKNPNAIRWSILSGILCGAIFFTAGWIAVALWCLWGKGWEMLFGGVLLVIVGAAFMSTYKEYRQLRTIEGRHAAIKKEMESIKAGMDKEAEELEKIRDEGKKGRLSYASYLRDYWAAKGRTEKCPSCGRGPEQYFGIDDPVLWARYDERDNRIEDAPRCRCEAERDLAYCPIDAEATVLAVLGPDDLDPCPECGVSRVLWTEIPETPENQEEPSEWEDYFQPAGGRLFKIFEVCAMCRNHVRMNSVTTGADMTDVYRNWKD
jgi:hypothetical protein